MEFDFNALNIDIVLLMLFFWRRDIFVGFQDVRNNLLVLFYS